MKNLIYHLSVISMTYIVIISCKSIALSPTYPLSDFSDYSHIVIAKIDNAKHSDYCYRPLETFNVTILKSLKGNLISGEQINGKAKKEQPKAVCPVHLDEGSEYLLLLTKGVGGYRISRFSFPIKKGFKYFDDYINQIKKILTEAK